MRTAFTQTLLKEAEKNPAIWLVTGDLGYSVLEPFRDRFPDRFINVGVAEQNMAGVSAGLALAGNKVFAYSIGNFATLRCLEQIRNDVAYHKLDVTFVAVGGGFVYGSHGFTHHATEDLAIMRALPEMRVLAPGDPVETRLGVQELCSHPGPAYLRLGKANEPVLQSEELRSMPQGQMIEVKSGKDALLISTGGMLQPVLQAAGLLSERGISAAVWSSPWLKPFDSKKFMELSSQFPLVVTAEEAQASGGLGSLVAELIAGLPATQSRPQLVRLGVPDLFLRTAMNQEAGREACGISPQQIATKVLEHHGQR